MQFGLFAVVVFLIFLEYAGSLSMLKGSRQRRISTDMTVVCSNGCESCSEINGCLKCLPKLFILLERNDIRQKGICLASCPVGYFGVRQPDMNKCIKCKIDNCEACFSKNFCTKCKEGLYLYKGKCYSSCPEGFTALNGTAECNSVVQCELGEWGPWAPCTKRGKQCGFKLGTQNRTREVLQPALSDPALCPSETENRKCTVQKKPCTKREKEREKNNKKNKDEQGKRNKENTRIKNQKETKDGKAGNRKKKGQQWATVSPALTPSSLQ